MNPTAMHKIHVIARIVISIIWLGLCIPNRSHLSDINRCLIAGIVLGDVITWIIYQIYLLPRNIMHFGISGIVNIAVVILLVKYLRISLPDSPEWAGMAIMVFMVAAAIKGIYYYMAETYFAETTD
ncbi:MAG: hypothetical protein ABSF80_06460 [Chitinispirillaceae bacterium]